MDVSSTDQNLYQAAFTLAARLMRCIIDVDVGGRKPKNPILFSEMLTSMSMVKPCWMRLSNDLTVGFQAFNGFEALACYTGLSK